MVISPRIRSVLQWSVGIIFILVGLVNIATPIAAFFAFAIGILKLPLVINFLQDKTGGKFTRPYRVSASIILFGMFVVALPNTTDNQIAPGQEHNGLQLQQTQEAIQQPVIEADPGQKATEDQEPSSAVPAASLSPAPRVEDPKPISVNQKSSCDPNYSGCVPIASDVDCSSGSGNGPAYTGRTTVIGTDIYDLDRDGDGVACE